MDIHKKMLYNLLHKKHKKQIHIIVHRPREKEINKYT